GRAGRQEPATPRPDTRRARRVRRPDLGSGTVALAARGRADRRSHPGDEAARARAGERRRRCAAAADVRAARTRRADRGAMSEKLYDGRHLSVESRDGKEVVVHGPAVAVVAVDGDGRVVLVRQIRAGAGGPLVELPAGNLDDGEPPETAARREL